MPRHTWSPLEPSPGIILGALTPWLAYTHGVMFCPTASTKPPAFLPRRGLHGPTAWTQPFPFPAPSPKLQPEEEFTLQDPH